MPLFGKRRAEEQAEARRQAARLEALEAAQSSFNTRFQNWLDAAVKAQVDTGASALTEEILDHVGPLPRPQANGEILTDTQLYFLASYARSYCGSMLERRRVSAVVAAAEAEKSGSQKTEQLKRIVEYHVSLQAHAAQILG
jgi:hypothetical protein